MNGFFGWDAQQALPGAYCPRCGGEIYPGEQVYRWEGRELCPDCFRAVVEGLLDLSPLLLAQDLGVEVRRIGRRREGGRPCV